MLVTADMHVNLPSKQESILLSGDCAVGKLAMHTVHTVTKGCTWTSARADDDIYVTWAKAHTRIMVRPFIKFQVTRPKHESLDHNSVFFFQSQPQMMVIKYIFTTTKQTIYVTTSNKKTKQTKTSISKDCVFSLAR